jgi:hypothetical protein
MKLSSRRLTGALLALCIGRAAGAQQVHGTVRDVTDGQPVAGAVLLLLDSNGVSRARNITDARGTYRIAASGWMKRMRVVRIGFRPSEVALPALSLATDAAEVDVSMTPLPTMLEPVHVSSGAKCSSRRDRIVALSLLEQARAGLLATIVAQEARPAEMIRLRTTSFLGDDDVVDSLRVHVDSSEDVRHAFHAAYDAADFVKSGFSDRDSSSDVFYAPDAETLLSDDFRDGYCFLLRGRDRNRPNAVGLGFAPAQPRRGRVDVDGTLWIDTVARRLLEIRYDYIGLPRAVDPAHAGGVVRFHNLDNGIVIIDAWGLRLPDVEVDSSRRSIDGRVKRVVIKAQVGGGMVASARWPDGFVWNAPLGAVRARMVDKAGNPQAGVTLILDETDYTGTSDSTGVVTIGRLVPGPYSGMLADPTLAPIDVKLQTPLEFSIVDSETVSTTVIVPLAVDYVENRCRDLGNGAPDRSAAWFIARVVDVKGKPVKNVEWSAARRVPGGRDTDPKSWMDLADARGRTGSDGIFQYCAAGLEVGDRVRLVARPTPKGRVQAAAIDLTGRITAVRLGVSPQQQ